MYSLVLMTAMASTPSTANFDGYFRDRLLGNGCSGTSCSGCSGSSCNGCCSSQTGLFSGDRIKAFFSFNGSSCSGCCGSSCTGYSCSGSAMPTGCCGSTMALPYTGVPIDMGSPYALPTPIPNPTPLIPPTALPSGPGTSPYAQPAPAEVREYSPKNQLPLPGGLAPSPNRATVIVKLPADAKLYAEGKELSLTSSERAFVTPELPPGREYSYTFRIEYERNGRVLGESKTIGVTPGKLITLEFSELATKSDPTPVPKVMPESKSATTTGLVKAEPVQLPAGERAYISVKVPPGATLYVNDAKQASSEFRTPPLPGGKEFTYTMRIDTTRSGLAEQVSQRVTFRAGDGITVDFTNGINFSNAIR